MFQSTRPRGARPRALYSFTSLQGCFNPRARGGRDYLSRRSSARSSVSIHAPAGGATIRNNQQAEYDLFQSTRPRGARHKGAGFAAILNRVSIHAPAGGATTGILILVAGMTFQSTRPRGARLNTNIVRCIFKGCFNPRARGGRDLFPGNAFLLNCKFQSTRPRGARPMTFPTKDLMLFVSIHAPAGGATIPHRMSDSRYCVSIHAPAGGATDIYIVNNTITGFQSTRPRGARPKPVTIKAILTRVSIHAPAGGATSGCAAGYQFRCGFNPRARGGRDC